MAGRPPIFTSNKNKHKNEQNHKQPALGHTSACPSETSTLTLFLARSAPVFCVYRCLTSAKAALFLLGNFFGSWVMKHYLQLKDTTVLLISLSSAVSHLILMALSDQGWHLYLSITVGMLSNLTLPTLKSIVAQVVEPDEVGKAYTATGITADLAFVTSTLVFNNVYKVTVAYFAGFVFLFAAFLLSLCILVVLWMAYDDYEQERNEETSEKCDGECKKMFDKQDSATTRF
uniref:Uncharacterized protein n=1 Tax=Romanomermis culicivorax TaxID=13658 RepID=A0A915KR71_ROMCU